MKKKKKLIIITGLSGSGKTYTLHTFEDIGYYCIDNLPVDLISTFLNLVERTKADISQIAIICDIREKRFIQNFEKTYDKLKKSDLDLTLLFLEANDQSLLRRYSESKRPHPLREESLLSEIIKKEREMLASIKSIADIVIDTSSFNVHQLKSFITRKFATDDEKTEKFRINIISFGFKSGLPLEADMILDVRFLPNPFFEPELKDKSGLDPQVVEFIEETDEFRVFFPMLKNLLNFLVPNYNREGKSYLNIAFGCTGGRHRSVMVAEEVYKILAKENYNVIIEHRDIYLSGL
jgi:UPF0042 nucleotide-binding protein